MATIATKVLWGDVSPKIYFDFSYEKQRVGSTQQYSFTVSAQALLTSTSYFGYPIYVQISLDGVVKNTFTLKSASPKSWLSPITSTTGWLDVANKTSGTTALKIYIYSGSGSSRSGTYTYTLEVDPAASTISATNATIEGKPTITINRASSSFTHTVTWAFGSLSGTVATKTTATSITNWAIPISFYSQIPSNRNGTCYLTCTTYSGDTAIGTATCQFVASTDEAKCKPSVSGTVEDSNAATIALTGDKNRLVRYYSTALCTISATAKNSATIKSATVNGNDISYSLSIPAVETGSFTFYAKDTREYGSSAIVSKTLVPYVKLTANASARGVDPVSGTTKITVSGNYYNGSFGSVSNALTIQYRQGNSGDYSSVTPTISGNTYSATISLSGLDYTQSYAYEVVVADKLASIPKPVTVKKGIPVFDWGENDFNFNVPVSFSGATMADHIVRTQTYSIAATGYCSASQWYARFHASGAVELWARVKINSVPCNSAWGSMYTGAITGSNVAFPFTFKSVPTVVVTHEFVSNNYWIATCDVETSKTATAKYQAVRPTSSTISGYLNYFVYGYIQ